MADKSYLPHPLLASLEDECYRISQEAQSGIGPHCSTRLICVVSVVVGHTLTPQVSLISGTHEDVTLHGSWVLAGLSRVSNF